MKVVFTGIHNKAGLEPLDSSTKSGKLIDRVIACINKANPSIGCIKVNLFNSDCIPSNPSADCWREDFFRRAGMMDELVTVVALGNDVRMYVKHNGSIIYVAHPSSIWSEQNKIAYIGSICKDIIQINEKA